MNLGCCILKITVSYYNTALQYDSTVLNTVDQNNMVPGAKCSQNFQKRSEKLKKKHRRQKNYRVTKSALWRFWCIVCASVLGKRQKSNTEKNEPPKNPFWKYQICVPNFKKINNYTSTQYGSMVLPYWILSWNFQYAAT